MPRVSIITPFTADRAPFMPRLEEIVKAQTFRDIEWLTDDGPGTVGEKRNRLVSRATGEFICHLDSDDIIAPDWVKYSLGYLQMKNAEVTGLDCFYYASNEQAWLYTYTGTMPYCAEGTMFYRRSAWERVKFTETSDGEGLAFCGNTIAVPHQYRTGFLATIHGGNTASHRAIPGMARVPYRDVQSIIDRIA